MKTFPITGIVIKRKDLGEADKLVTLFTKECGKVVLIAKGIKKISSRRASHMELFNVVKATVYQSYGGYFFLSEISTITTQALLKSDLKTVGLAYHICELIEGLCPENEPHNAIFNALQQLLLDLPVTKRAGELIHSFEVFLLSKLGYYANPDLIGAKQDLEGSKASLFIESILERKLKSRQILPYLL